MFDLNNFIFSCSVALMGLNKESIENSDNHKEYGYKIDYNLPSNIMLEKTYNDFKKFHNVDNPYSKWLAVTSVSPDIPSDNNYLFNVRNSLMHSEYDYEFENDESYNYINVNLHNSNYTGFEGKLYIPYYLEFMKHYYSNDAYFGILSNFYVMGESGIKPTKETLDEYLRKTKLQKYKYENKKDSSRRWEKKLYKKNPKINDSDFEKEEVSLTEEDINKAKMLIEKYYGDDFYKYPREKQGRITFQVLKYIKDSKTVLSEWIVHYYLCAREAIKHKWPGDEFISGFASEASLLMIKSYLLLYRIQNKNFDEIDYDLMDDIDYEFDTSEPHYSDFKNKLIDKGVVVDEDEYKKRYFCEIYRNSLAHGNISVDVRRERDGSIKQYFVFEDIYKSRTRKIAITQEELKRFTNFEAFSRKEAKVKTVSITIPTSRR